MSRKAQPADQRHQAQALREKLAEEVGKYMEQEKDARKIGFGATRPGGCRRGKPLSPGTPEERGDS